MDKWWLNLERYENKNNSRYSAKKNKLRRMTAYSEHGEEGVIRHIFDHIGIDSKFCVEIGARDGYSDSNTRWLIRRGWSGLGLEKRGAYFLISPSYVKHHTVTLENINDLFAKYDVPFNIDFLSIDIDYNDFWVLKSILEEGVYSPKLICFEFNPVFGPHESKSVPYNERGKKRNSRIYGASIAAFVKLGNKHGYKLIHSMTTPSKCFESNRAGRNAFLLQSKYLPSDFNLQVEQVHPAGWNEDKKKKKLQKNKRYIYSLDQFIEV